MRSRLARTHRSLAWMALALLASVAVLGAAPQSKGAPATRTAPQTLHDITDEGSFRAAFDGAAAAPRLVLLLSPT